MLRNRTPLLPLCFTLFLLTSLLVGGCAAFEDPSQRATQNAENTALAETVSSVDQQQETLSALRATADSAVLLESQITQVAAERNALQATLTVIGSSGGPAPAQATNPNPGPASTPSTLDGGAPAGPGPSSTPSNAGPQYTNSQMASALTDDFCAANNQANFEMGAETIYFVTVAQNISQGTRYSLRISEEGQIRNLDTNFWTSDDNYERTCIYYGIDENNIPFEPGTYTVELLVNDQTVAQATFTIN